jgi:hypothetical protein
LGSGCPSRRNRQPPSSTRCSYRRLVAHGSWRERPQQPRSSDVEESPSPNNVMKGFLLYPIHWLFVNYSFVDASGIMLNAGTKTDLRAGDVLYIERLTPEIRDPQSGEVVRKLTRELGKVPQYRKTISINRLLFNQAFG